MKTAEAMRLLQVAEEEKQCAMNNRNNEPRRARGAELRDMSKESGFYDKSIGKLKHGIQSFYDHVDYGYEWLKRFNPLDVPALIVAILKKLGRDANVDYCRKTLMADGMKSARSALLKTRTRSRSTST